MALGLEVQEQAVDGGELGQGEELARDHRVALGDEGAGVVGDADASRRQQRERHDDEAHERRAPGSADDDADEPGYEAVAHELARS